MTAGETRLGNGTDHHDPYRTAMDLIDEGFCVIEIILDDGGAPVDYLFIDINRNFARQSGLDDPVGKRALELVPDLEASWVQTYGRVALTGQPASFINSAAALGQRTYDVNAYRIGGDDSLRVGIVFKDISDRVLAERMRQDYIAMVSHDLGTPMTIVRGQAQLMKRRHRYSDEQVDTIIEQTRRMQHLLAGLRNAIRAESGWLELTTVESDLAREAEAAVERARLQGTGHDVRFSSDGPVLGRWDPERLGQIFDNLIGNALKYSYPASVIDVKVDRAGNAVRFEVTDRGPGVPPDMLPHLFDRFFRANSDGSTEGMGLGLYIVRTLVRAKGGEVNVASTPGVGSTFTVTLPIHRN